MVVQKPSLVAGGVLLDERCAAPILPRGAPWHYVVGRGCLRPFAPESSFEHRTDLSGRSLGGAEKDCCAESIGGGDQEEYGKTNVHTRLHSSENTGSLWRRLGK